MPNYKVVNSDQLDSDITVVADAIREKSGTSGKMAFPNGMADAVRSISSGVELPELDNPGTAGDVALGKQFIDGNGSVIEGTLEEKYVLQISDQVSVETDDGTIELVAPVQTDCIIRKGKYSRLIARASAFGDALPEQVTKGTTFTSAYGVNIEGTMEPGSGGVNTSDATATAEDIAIGKTAYVNGEMVTGTIEDGDTWHYYYNGGVSAYEEDGAICFDHAFDKDVLYRKGERIILAHSDLGDALPQEVVKGRTFTTSKGVKIEGTMEPGSGGSEAVLNFEVVGGTAAPANPSENTIWMNTDQNITGWYLSHSEPTEPSEGMAWICLGAFGDTEFNALKENGIQIFLIAGYQYINHVWEKKPIECYQNGEWVEFTKILLFNSGNQFAYLTGGWIAVNAGITIVVGEEIVSDITGGSNRDASVYTHNLIDVTDFSTLVCRVNKDSGKMNFGITKDNSSLVPQMNAKTLTTVSGEQEVRVNLSDISGLYYIAIHFDVCKGRVSSVWLER